MSSSHSPAVDVLPHFPARHPGRRNRLDDAVSLPVVAPTLPDQRPSRSTESLSATLCSTDELLLAIAQAPSPAAIVHIALGLTGDADAGDLARAGSLLAWAFAPAPVALMPEGSFATVLPHTGSDELEHRVRRALSLLCSTDLSVDGRGVRTTASAGITILDRPARTTHEEDGDPAASRIREALDRDAFVLHAQPVRSVHQDLQQWELLLRLTSPEGAVLAPGEFLPSAERSGLAVEVDRWVTQQAIGLIASWAAVGQPLSLEVNVSAATLRDKAFVAMVERELLATGIKPRSLVFEIRGEVAGAHPDRARWFAERVRSLGCRFALDAFGRNAGALEQLTCLPLDLVKLDGSFVRHVATDEAERMALQALTQLAHRVGLDVVATNVADAATRDAAVAAGVDFVQGFFVGRPIPIGPRP